MKAITGILFFSLIFLLQSCGDNPPPNTSTDANFSASGYDVPVPANISFINTSKNAATYEWSFGDGTTSTAFNPTHTYTTMGTYFLKLKATGPNGVDSVCKVLFWGDASDPTQSSFSYFMDRCTGTPVNFAFNSLNPSSNNYNWDFGNGNIGLVKNPIVQYSAPGTYMIKFSSQIGGVRDTVELGLQIF